MFPIPPHEHLVEERKCRQCSALFPITDKDMEFYEKVSPVFNGKKLLIPPPTLCPECRQQRRLSFRNERKLYKRNCDATGKEIISIYSPDKPYTVYHQDYWWSDAWDPMEYGREFDFSRGAMEQFGILIRDVPQMGLSVVLNKNCDFTNQCGNSKDCYYSFDVGMAENCLYSNFIDDSSFLTDCSSTHESHDCYNCTDTLRCQQSLSLIRCENCSFSERLVDCIGCEYCLECINLTNKKYFYRNNKYSKEEWLQISAQYKYNLKSWEEFLVKQPRKNLCLIKSENCFGDAISDSKNSTSSFEIKESEDIKYVDRCRILTDCMDIRGFGNGLTFSYDCLAVGDGSSNLVFSSHCWQKLDHVYYCIYCLNGTKNCFLCTGLRNKSYCILNKQYTKEEYEILVPKIIEKMREDGEWGEFFPATMSPFGYNETIANEYYPITSSQPSPKGEGASEHATFRKIWFPLPLSEGEGAGGGGGAWFNWSLYESPFPKVEKIIKANMLPDAIEGIPDDILNWAIECEVTGKPFRIIRQELEFYRKHNIPIPRRHPDQRHLDRMKQRNPRKLFERNCDCCKKPMITTYSPERPETVYCGACYEKEVIG